jgi:colicin import membrane protein
MLSKRILLAALLSLSITWTAASSRVVQQTELLREEFHQTYPLAAQGRVSLGNINGAVRVTGWDRNEVKVDAVKMAYRRDRLDEAKIIVRSDPNGIHIETEYPHHSQSFTTGEGRSNNPATVEYTLTVPRGARIDSIELINGNLDIDSLTGDVKGSSINGRVSGRELMGEVRLSTINGRVEAVFSRLSAGKSISLGSVNGPVSLTIPSDSNAELKASTVHGGISNEFGLPIRRGDYVGRDLAGQLGQGGTRIKLGNVNGMISIKHAQDGRPLSRVTNLLAEKVKSKHKDDKDDDYDSDVERVRSEARRASIEATREAARARAEARRAQVEAQRAQADAQKAQRQAQIEAQRAQQEARRVQLEAQREQAENLRAARAAQVEAQRVQIEAQKAQRQAQVDAQRAQVEAVRAAREAQRAVQQEAARIRTEAQRALHDRVRVNPAETGAGNTLRLVERESKTFPVSGTPRLNVQTFDGYITVHGWDKQEVYLTISKRAASEQHMRGIRLRTDQSGSSINVVAEFAQNTVPRAATLTYPNAVVNLEIFVPRNSAVRLFSGDGRLELDGVNGNLELNTGDGRIEVRDSKGRLTATTGDGRIQVENFNGEVQARTGDGRIILDGRFAQLAARTGSGSILLSLPADFNATIETDAESVDNQGLTLAEESSTSRRLKRWKIGRGGNILTLRTGEGRVFLRRAGER